ncbi:MAG: peptide chain release factor N(5)-glutamine methyltransferase [Lachnospiraceae bacterium]|nr:peptide chain release factor N(5)-glutamine methyltransferase [Lachnospiraceae bacterium]
MRYWELQEKGRKALKEAGVSEWETDAFILFEHAAGLDRSAYLLRQSEEASGETEGEYMSLVSRRSEGVPVQYITGHACFMGLDFQVNGDVLIPRFDTEVLVETVLSHLPASGEVDILDMCTGSGCIAVSLSVLGRKKGCGLNVYASDISEEAVHVAKKNAEANGADIMFFQADLFENMTGVFDIIVSNPPYIRTAEIEELDDTVRDHEPRRALDGDEDGLRFYREITKDSLKHLKNNGLLFYEIGYDQGKDVEMIMGKAGFKDVCIVKDLAGLDRVIWGRR